MNDEHAYLLWRSGPRAGSRALIDCDYFIIGRDPTRCHLRVTLAGISRQHAALKTDAEGAVTLIDLFSRNGTYVNGEAVCQRKLADGDQIDLGRDGSVAFDYYAGSGQVAASDSSGLEEPYITLAQDERAAMSGSEGPEFR